MTCFCRAVFEMSVDQGALFGRVNISLKCRERSELERDAGMVTREVPGKAPGWRHHLQQRSDLSFKPTNKARMVRDDKKRSKKGKREGKRGRKRKISREKKKAPSKASQARPTINSVQISVVLFFISFPRSYSIFIGLFNHSCISNISNFRKQFTVLPKPFFF